MAERFKHAGAIALLLLGGCDAYSDPIVVQDAESVSSYRCGGQTLSAIDRDRYEALLGSLFTWVTGSAVRAAEIPAVEVAPYCGVDTFLPDVRQNDLGLEMLEVLTSAQRAELTPLRVGQASEWQAFLEARSAIVTQLFALKQGTKIDEAAVLEVAAQYGQHQGEIANEQLAALGAVLAGLSAAQRTHLEQVANQDIAPLDGHGSAPEVALELDALSTEERAIQLSLAVKALAWSQGSLAQSQKVTARKVASFFGFGFYRFAPSEGGLSNQQQRDLLMADVTGLLEQPQRDVLCQLLDDERETYDSLVASRQRLVTETQPFLDRQAVDTAKVVTRSEDLARIEARLAIRRAKVFHQLEGDLTAEQAVALQTLRQATEAERNP